LLHLLTIDLKVTEVEGLLNTCSQAAFPLKKKVRNKIKALIKTGGTDFKPWKSHCNERLKALQCLFIAPQKSGKIACDERGGRRILANKRTVKNT
jgi:hypothetical protein